MQPVTQCSPRRIPLTADQIVSQAVWVTSPVLEVAFHPIYHGIKYISLGGVMSNAKKWLAGKWAIVSNQPFTDY